MKTIDEILNNYKEYETFLEDRFGRRLCPFLTIDQMSKIGFSLNEKLTKSFEPKEWTYENVLLQLEEDAKFGLEKAEDMRGISSNLMYEVCKSWCKVIDKEDLIDEYYDYGISTFKSIINFIETTKKEVK